MLLPVFARLCLSASISQLLLKKRNGRGSDSISLALPCLWGPGLVGLVMQWELPELDFSAHPATSKKNCRTHEAQHATKTGKLHLTGVRADCGRAGWLADWLGRLCKPYLYLSTLPEKESRSARSKPPHGHPFDGHSCGSRW